MKRRYAMLVMLAALTATPALAAETARRRGGGTAAKKPGVAERANNRVRRTTETSTADNVKNKAGRGDAAMNRLVGNKKR